MRTTLALLGAALTCMASLKADLVDFYVTDKGGSFGNPGTFVSIVDVATSKVEGYVDCNGFDLTHPIDIHFNSDNTKAYVTCDTSNAVYVINTLLRQVVGKVGDALNPFSFPQVIEVNFHTTPNTAYVTNSTGGMGGTGSVSVINLSVDLVSGPVDDTLAPFNDPIGVALSDDGTTLLVANFNGADVSIIDTATNAATGTVTVGAFPFHLPVLVAWKDNIKAYVSDIGPGVNMGFVNVIESGVVTHQVIIPPHIPPFPVFEQPLNIYEGPTGTIYILDFVNNNVYEIDGTDTVAHIFTPASFNAPLGMVITPDNTTGYVANSGDNTVSILDIATRTVTSTVDATGFPFFKPYQIAITSTPPAPPPVSTSVPLRPICIHGEQQTDRFAAQSELYNTINWCPSPSAGTVKYHLYRNGVLIKTFNTNEELTFEEHDVTKKKIVYSVTAVGATGQESPAVTVAIP